jgi:hypothetical protein
VPELLSRPIRQEKEVNGKQIEKKEDKLSLFSHDRILYVKDTHKSTSKIHRFEFSFLYTKNE